MTPTAIRVEVGGERTEAVWPAAALAAAGLVLLLLRVRLLGNPSASLLFAVTYILLGAASLTVPIAPDEGRRVSPVIALAIGVGAMAVGTLAVGPRLPVPLSPEILALNSLAAFSEEVFFRRFLYGRLARFGAVAAVAATALLFALIHLPAYGVAAFWVDLGAGLLLSWQRWACGSWTVPAATHVAANLLAVMP